MLSVNMVRPDELEPEELRLLVQYANKCWKPFPVEDLILRVRNGVACIYRLTGPKVKGIFILSVGDGDLYLETISGKGLVKHFPEIYEAIKQTALSCGAKELYNYVERSSVKKLYERHTRAAPVTVLYKETLR